MAKMMMKEGKKALHPHKEDRLVEKPEYKKEMDAEHGGEHGDFEEGHRVVDSMASGVKKARLAHKMKHLSSMNYDEGVGAPGNEMAKLPGSGKKSS